MKVDSSGTVDQSWMFYKDNEDTSPWFWEEIYTGPGFQI